MNEELNDISISMADIEGENEAEDGNETEEVNENVEVNENQEVNENDNEMNRADKKIDIPKVDMEFDSYADLFDYYQAYATQEGFGVTKRTQKKSCGVLRYVTISCNRAGELRSKGNNSWKPHPTTKTDCEAKLNAVLCSNGKWRVSKLVLGHNHAKSPSNFRFFQRNWIINSSVKGKLEVNDMVGIRPDKSFPAVKAGGIENLPFLEKDCRNYTEQVRRLRFGEGDAAAIQKYFSKMQDTNSRFFYRMDIDEEGHLKNVFWADERSRASYEEFGDVVTFDTTYLTNKYEIPFAPFVGVNHHGQSTLFGCALISREDTETFIWLFEAWLACMCGNAPSGIITDQDNAMQNAIEIVFPSSRHRWCLSHIMKKLPKIFGGYEDHESITTTLKNVVYDSLTYEEFEVSWNGMIEKFQLESNEWLLGLYSQRHRWVPIFLKDSFWAGMSTTQRSEIMHAFFDGNINSKTTLKQFVEQYENALRNKVDKEKLADYKSCNSCIPCISPYIMEKQIQGAYTTAKFKEFQDEMRGIICCRVSSSREHDALSECDVVEDVDIGGKIKCANFKVWLNRMECDDEIEVKCNCRLFEFRGILCRHAVSVLTHNQIYTIPDKYILRRWRKDIKRRHSKVKVSYDDWKDKPEGQRFDKMCAAFREVADLASDYDDTCNMVMDWIMKLNGEVQRKNEFRDSSPTSHTTISMRSICGDVNATSNENRNVPSPLAIRSKGRPPIKRKQSMAEQILKVSKEKNRKKTTQKKTTDDDDGTRMQISIGTDQSINMTPEGVSYGFQQQQFMHGIMSPQVVGHGFQHNFMPGNGIMTSPSMISPQQWRHSSSGHENVFQDLFH